MHLALGSDIFDSFRRYQSRLIREYNRLAVEFEFITVDARRPIETIQAQLRHRISAYLRVRTLGTLPQGPTPAGDVG